MSIKYIPSFFKSCCLYFVIFILVGRIIGFDPFYITPLSWNELFMGKHLFIIIVLPAMFAFFTVYFEKEKDNEGRK